MGRFPIIGGCIPAIFLESNGIRDRKNSPSLEETALNRAVMEAIQRIIVNDGEFVDAFRQNVIRVIESYGQADGPDEYTDKIKEKEQGINALKEQQIEAGKKKKLAVSYEQRVKDIDAFITDNANRISERRLIASVKVISDEKIQVQFQSGIVVEQGIRYE